MKRNLGLSAPLSSVRSLLLTSKLLRLRLRLRLLLLQLLLISCPIRHVF